MATSSLLSNGGFGVATGDSDDCSLCRPCCWKGYHYTDSEYTQPSAHYLRDFECCGDDWVVEDAELFGRRVRIEGDGGASCGGLCWHEANVRVLDKDSREVLGSATEVERPCCACIRTYPDMQAKDAQGMAVAETLVYNGPCDCFKICCKPREKDQVGCCCPVDWDNIRRLARPGTEGDQEIAWFKKRARRGACGQFYPSWLGITLPAGHEEKQWPMVAMTHLVAMRYGIK